MFQMSVEHQRTESDLNGLKRLKREKTVHVTDLLLNVERPRAIIIMFRMPKNVNKLFLIRSMFFWFFLLFFKSKKMCLFTCLFYQP